MLQNNHINNIFAEVITIRILVLPRQNPQQLLTAEVNFEGCGVNSVGGSFCWNYATDTFYSNYVGDTVRCNYAVALTVSILIMQLSFSVITM